MNWNGEKAGCGLTGMDLTSKVGFGLTGKKYSNQVDFLQLVTELFGSW
jgi:hypothetical protein